MDKHRQVFKELCLKREDRMAAQKDPVVERFLFPL